MKKMTNLKRLSGNEISEMLHALNRVIYTLENDFLHVAEYMGKEIETLKKKRDLIVNEKERREDLF